MSIFKQFDADDIVPGNPTEITTGLWSGDTGSLNQFFTSSVQASSSLSGQYYWNVFQSNPNITSTVPIPEIQFAVAYGNRNGGGAPTLNDDDNATLSTQAVYSQYRNMLLESNDSQFTFGTVNSDHIYVINVARSRTREKLDPGNWQLALSGTIGRSTFIDDSNQTIDPTLGKGGAIFNVVSGTLDTVSGSIINSTGSGVFGRFGLFYPNLGIIVLNPNAISSSIGLSSTVNFYSAGSTVPFAPVTGSSTVHQYNHVGLFRAIRLGGDFQARSAETISSTNLFIRVKNKDFNYSNNPTFYDENTGNLINNTFIKDPRVFITTIGMYNNNNELLAVGKTSRPIPKSFDRELLIRIKLDW